MMGSILHTINVRLSPEQLVYTISHAENEILFVYKDFLPLIDKIARQFETVKKIGLIGDGDPNVHTELDNAGEYESLINTYNDVHEFPDIDENTVATAFYITGTTGNPKGVCFTHRQLVLHTLAAAGSIDSYPDPINFIYNDVYMPLTPMFHVHAWGIRYLAIMMGVKQIYPGRYEPEMLLKLLVRQKVTFPHYVPTILQKILGAPIVKNIDLSNWKVVIGGSALSSGMAKMAIDKGIKIMTGSGLSETCPILTLAQFKQGMENLISQCEQIKEAAVIGVPDEKWGDRPVAYIVPKPEFKDTITVDVCKKSLQPFVEAGVIEKWVIPDEFIFVDEIPKTSVGKIDKKVLRANYKK